VKLVTMETLFLETVVLVLANVRMAGLVLLLVDLAPLCVEMEYA
jgi:hypothetical protein